MKEITTLSVLIVKTRTRFVHIVQHLSTSKVVDSTRQETNMEYIKVWEKIEAMLKANGFHDLSQLQSLQIAGGNLTIEWHTDHNMQYKEANRIRIIGFLDHLDYQKSHWKPIHQIEPTSYKDGDIYRGETYCVKCKEKRSFEGKIKVSESGRRMAQGICPVCATKVNRILGKA